MLGEGINSPHIGGDKNMEGRTQISVFLPDVIYQQLRRLKYEQRISSHNAAIIEAILDFLEKMEGTDVPKGE